MIKFCDVFRPIVLIIIQSENCTKTTINISVILSFVLVFGFKDKVGINIVTTEWLTRTTA